MQTSPRGCSLSASAPSITASATGWSSPATSMPRSPPVRILGQAPAGYAGFRACDQSQGFGRARLLARRFRGDRLDSIIVRDAGMPAFRKLVTRDGRLSGAVLVGDTGDAILVCGASSALVSPCCLSRRARVWAGVCGGGVMGDRDFSDEQKRYLEGFVSGLQASRMAAGLKPLAGVAGTTASANRTRCRAPLRHGAFRGRGPQALWRGKGQARRASLRCLCAFKRESAEGQLSKGRR